MPVLDIAGKKDDLVPPQSSKSIMNAIENKDKKLIEFPTGHVGRCKYERIYCCYEAWNGHGPTVK